MAQTHAFSVDDRTDRDQASDGSSRYGAYLRQRAYTFFEDSADQAPTTSAVHFALAAWTTAVPPVMGPGYVLWHPRIQDAERHWDEDGHAAIAVHLALPAPTVAGRLHSRWRGWTYDHIVKSWCDPTANDRITVLTSAVIRVPLAPNHLPAPHYQHGLPHVPTAKRAIATICRLLNTDLDDVLAALDSSESAG